MRPDRYEPLTLGNMRRNGVRRLMVYCGAIDCHHGAAAPSIVTTEPSST
jgi:hypothetical protein